MTKRRLTSTPALTVTAALLLGSVSSLALSSSAQAATGPDRVVVSLPTTSGKPGVAQVGSVTVTEAGQPVAGQTVTLSLDHGFFATGKEKTPSVVRAKAGNLQPTGASTAQSTTLTGTTNAQGVLAFDVAIERDPGFDDDGAVTSAVTATAGAVSGTTSAGWSSGDPLNGGSVDVVLSPSQDQAVAPTVSGDRTYYDVVTRDQFGNAVAGEDVSFIPTGTGSEPDYSENFFVSNLDGFGDFWVRSDDPSTVSTTVTWEDAPTYLYTDTAGAAAPGPVKDVEATTAVSYYDVSFAGSSYSIASSANGNVSVGTTVTNTVTVTDQRGRPVRGYDVQFFRFGPEASGGEKLVERETNALGQASYSYVGSVPGSSKVTAVVTDGLSRRTLTSTNGFRYDVGVTLKGAKDKATTKGKGKKAAKSLADPKLDVLDVRVGKLAAGAAVSVYRVAGGGLKPVKAKGAELDDSGRAIVAVKDRNGKRATRYVVVVGQTAITFGATSAEAKVR